MNCRWEIQVFEVNKLTPCTDATPLTNERVAAFIALLFKIQFLVDVSCKTGCIAWFAQVRKTRQLAWKASALRLVRYGVALGFVYGDLELAYSVGYL